MLIWNKNTINRDIISPLQLHENKKAEQIHVCVPQISRSCLMQSIYFRKEIKLLTVRIT